MQGKMYM